MPPKSVAELISIIGAAAAAAPEIATFVRSLSAGERSAVDRLIAVLPQESATAAWARETRYAERYVPPDPPFRGVLAALDEAETDPLPPPAMAPEYE